MTNLGRLLVKTGTLVWAVVAGGAVPGVATETPGVFRFELSESGRSPFEKYADITLKNLRLVERETVYGFEGDEENQRYVVSAKLHQKVSGERRKEL